MHPGYQAMLLQSLFDLLLHGGVKYRMNEMDNVNVMIIPIHLRHINLHLGTTNTTTNLQLPTPLTTTTIPLTTITVPQKSGDLGSIGRIIQNPNITLILPDGSTFQSGHTSINHMMNLLPNIHPNP
jgi:hypothetical protein